MAGLHWADYVIFVGFLGISLGIGLFHAFTGGRQRSTQEFIMANRQLTVLPTLLSLFVSYQSAIMILGRPAEIFARGIQSCVMEILGFTIAFVISERLIVPWIYTLKMTSIYEYFDLRYNSKAVRIYGACIGIFSAVLYMGVAMYAPSTALEIATGLPTAVSIPVMAAFCVTYTALGGMRAVVWTDVLQFLVMAVGMLAIAIKGAIEIGGFKNAIDAAGREGRLNWINLNPNPTERHTLWGFLFGFTTNWIYVYGLQQASVQRYSATTNLRNARLIMLLNVPIVILTTLLVFVIGLQVLAYYVNNVGCDPLASGRVRHPNQILPDYVKIVFEEFTGFYGIFLTTLYSGAMSSVSSSLSAVAANTWRDVLQYLPFFNRLGDNKAAFLNKALVLVFGCLATGVAFMVAYVPGPLTQVCIAFLGASGGPLFGMFLLGGAFHISEWRGTLIGGVLGLITTLWIAVGSITIQGQHPRLPHTTVTNCTPAVEITRETPPVFTGIEHVYTISYLWYSPIGVIVSMVIGLTISAVIYVFNGKSQESSNIQSNVFIQWRAALTFSKMPQDSPSTADALQLKTFKTKDTISDSKVEKKNDIIDPLLEGHRQ